MVSRKVSTSTSSGGRLILINNSEHGSTGWCNTKQQHNNVRQFYAKPAPSYSPDEYALILKYFEEQSSAMKHWNPESEQIEKILFWPTKLLVKK